MNKNTGDAMEEMAKIPLPEGALYTPPQHIKDLHNDKNTGDGELDKIFKKYWPKTVLYPNRLQPGADEAKAKLKHLIAQEANRASLKSMSDLMWCIGNLRGLGHPAEHLEKEYGLTGEKESNDG